MSKPPRTRERAILSALIVYSALLFGLAVGPPLGVVVETTAIEIKLHHVGAYALHTLIVWLYLKERHLPMAPALPASAAFSFVFGVLIELVQWPLPYRSGAWQDLIQNLIGIGVAIAFVWWLVRRAER